MLQQHDQTSRRMTQAMLDVARVLTPEQRARLGERMRDREARMEDRMKRMEPSHVDNRQRRAVDRGTRGAHPMTPRLLLVDDDSRLASMVGDYLGRAGFEVETAGTLAGARSARRNTVRRPGARPDAARRRRPRPAARCAAEPRTRSCRCSCSPRAASSTASSASSSAPTTTCGKPFEPRELLARVKALLRRSRRRPRDDVLRFGRLEIDLGSRRPPRRQALRPDRHQFDLLVVLGAEPGPRALARPDHGCAQGPSARGLRPLDRRPHRASAPLIEDDPKAPRRVLTVRGAGYVFAQEAGRRRRRHRAPGPSRAAARRRAPTERRGRAS